ncbi:MAG: SMC-Scp complex subunit ScpB [Planctomycetota bacterium]|nr:SMC-Scp complex subunit ScpB [Planctomycetota bacterium]
MVQEIEIESIARAIEAVLFATGETMSIARLAQIVDVPETQIEKALLHLKDRLVQSGSALTLESVAGGFKLFSLPAYHSYIEKAKKTRRKALSPAALETLAIIAWRHKENSPVRRAEIESLRGISCGEHIRALMEAGLVRVVGRDPARGRALLYGTTKKFLELFGIKSLEELPDVSSLRLESE